MMLLKPGQDMMACPAAHAPASGCTCEPGVLTFADRRCLSGAFGTVYKAVLDDVDQVAVKMLPSAQFTRHQLRAFLNEVGAEVVLHICGTAEHLQWMPVHL